MQAINIRKLFNNIGDYKPLAYMNKTYFKDILEKD